MVALQAIAILNVLYLVIHIVGDIVHGTQTAPPFAVAMGLTLFSGGPWLAVARIRRRLAATLEIGDAHLVVSRPRSRIEIPLASVKTIRPFSLPLPGPGLGLVMNSGHSFRYAIEADEPGALLSALAGDFDSARAAQGQRVVAYADAKSKYGKRRRSIAALKWILMPLALGVILFRLDQYIMFGGAFGQYRLHGLGPYLKSFATYWAGATSYLVLYASVVRLAVEPLALLVTLLATSRARLVRRIAELACHAAYFGLVPAFVAYRLLL